MSAPASQFSFLFSGTPAMPKLSPEDRLPPASRNNDPLSSKRAEAEVKRVGVMRGQRVIALSLVEQYPGLTSKQLAGLGTLDRYQLGRRLPELEKMKLPGTWQTIRMAFDAGKKVTIIKPDGGKYTPMRVCNVNSMEPYYQDESVTIYHGDSVALRSGLRYDAIITDPPYGMEWESNQRFSGGNTRRGKGTKHERITGDTQAFDPSPWLSSCPTVIWGANHFWNGLPSGAALVWQKRNLSALGTFLSDAEIAYMNVGVGVYVYVKVFAGSSRAIDGAVGAYEGSLHPNQKPVDLMVWCMEKAKVPESATVVDPYMGSGTTAIACIRTGRKFIGIDIDLAHVKTAATRIERERSVGILDFAATA